MLRTTSFLMLINVILHRKIPWRLTENYGFRKLPLHENKYKAP